MDSKWNSFKKLHYNSLLEGQKRILEDIEKSFFPVIEEENPKYFPTLVRMPTGTGKTGIIGITSYLANEFGSTLVLTPWKNLCEQLQDDLDFNFWDKIGLDKNEIKEIIFPTIRMLPSKLEKILESDNKSRKVFVGTFSGLQKLQRENTELYEKLASTLKLVIVDEGHYEPAVLWGGAIKKLDRPTLILTATPYRNDLKLFRVSKNNVFHYKHSNAINAPEFPLREVKSIKLEASSLNFNKVIEEFAELWKTRLKVELPDKEPRAIICCESKKNIMSAMKIIDKAGISCKGFHERVEDEDFKSNPKLKEQFCKIVPNAKESSEEIWIHQHKLTEGLDDSRFCAILLTYPFTNDRKLVQQVGRVLRHSTNLPDNYSGNQNAYIIHCSDYEFDEVWHNYLNYEKIIKLTTGEHYRKVIKKYLKIQPEYEYFEKKFRQRLSPFINNGETTKDNSTGNFQLNEKWIKEVRESILTPPSALILKIKDSFDIKDFVEDSTTGLMLRDAVILGNESEESPVLNENGKLVLWIYAKIKNSDILLTKSAYEISIEARFIYQVRSYLFIGDTSGVAVEDYLKKYAVSCTYFDLEKCLDKEYIIRQASLFNTQSLNTAVRRTVRQGISLEDSPYQISEKKYICQNIRAKQRNNGGERYFGLTTGRISDRLNTNDRRSFNIDNFISWAEKIANILDKDSNKKHDFLSRYANIAPKPPKALPYMLILDPNPDPGTLINSLNPLEDIDNQTINWLLVESEEEIDIELTVFDFSKSSDDTDWPFLLEIDINKGEKYLTNIIARYDSEKGRFQFKKGSETNIQVTYKNDIFSVEHFLNSRQDRYAITLKQPSLAYHNNQFFELDYSKAEKKFANYIRKISHLKNVDFEKISSTISDKEKKELNNWPNESLFNKTLKYVAIEKEFGAKIEWLFCDDPNKEIADFIIASFSQKKIAFIHCKYGRGKGISASAFHDLTSQAGKNLVYLRTNRTPPNINNWHPNSKWNKTQIKRWSKGRKTLPQKMDLWKKIKDEILDFPGGKVEVWLVMGDGLDVDSLKTITNTPKETHEVGPLLHLLDGLVANCAESAVDLRIYGN